MASCLFFNLDVLLNIKTNVRLISYVLLVRIDFICYQSNVVDHIQSRALYGIYMILVVVF